MNMTIERLIVFLLLLHKQKRGCIQNPIHLAVLSSAIGFVFLIGLLSIMLIEPIQDDKNQNIFVGESTSH